MQSMEPDDPFLVAFWDRICIDHEWNDPEQRSSEARRKFLSTLAVTRCLLSKGPKSALSRWFSVLSAWRFLDQEVHTKLFILAFLCCMYGWCSSYSSLKLASPSARSQSAPPARSASSSAPASSAAVVKKAINDEKAQLLKASKNTLHVVAKYLSDDILVSEARAIMLVGKPLHEEHSALAKSLGSPESVKSYYADCACFGLWCKTMQDTIRTLSDLISMKRIGFNVSFASAMEDRPSEDELGVEDGLANSLWRLRCCVLTERCSSMVMHVGSYPLALAGILSNDPSKAIECMARFKSDWEMYEKAMEVRHPS